jgi:hypothetical protein
MTKPWARGSARLAVNSSSCSCRPTSGHCSGGTALAGPAERAGAITQTVPGGPEWRRVLSKTLARPSAETMLQGALLTPHADRS